MQDNGPKRLGVLGFGFKLHSSLFKHQTVFLLPGERWLRVRNRRKNMNMKEVIMAGPRHSVVHEVPVPEIKDNEILVKVLYTGMCHSEWYPWSTAKGGEHFGHEAVGKIVKLGKAVKG